MLKILFVISNLNLQGPIKQLFYLCKYIDKTKIEPIIVTTSQSAFKHSMHNMFIDIGIEVIDLKLSNIQSVFKATQEIQSIIDINKIDLVQSFGFRSDIISSRLKRVYKITTVRNTLLYNWKMIWGVFFGAIFGEINLSFIRKFDSVIACSYSVHNYLKSIKLNSDVIVNSIDTESVLIKPSCSVIKTNRKLLKLPINETVFTTISSKLKGKNIEFLIDFFKNLDDPNKHLVIAGYVAPEVLNKYSNLENILFIGKVNNLKDYLLNSDFFISASLHEGMPNAVLEAMAVGTPVILSDISPHEEIHTVSPNKIGVIFKNNNYDDLKNKIQDVLTENYSKLSENCIQSIYANFNAKTMAKKHEDYYLAKVNH